MKKVFFMTILIILGLGLAACSSSNKLNIEQVEEPSSAAFDVSEKYNAYVSLYDALIGQDLRESGQFGKEYERIVSESFELTDNGEIIDWVDFKGMSIPTYNYVVGAIGRLEPMLEEQPPMEIDKTTSKLIPLLKKQLDLFSQMTSYYDTQEYLVDELKGAKEYHSEYLKTMVGLDEVIIDFFEEFEDLQLEQQKKERDVYEKKGLIARVILLDIMTGLNRMGNILGDSEYITHIEDEEEVIISDEGATLLESKLKELEQYESRFNELDESDFRKANIFDHDVLSIKHEIKLVTNKIRELLNMTKSDTNISESSLEDFFDNFNRLVETYNRMI